MRELAILPPAAIEILGHGRAQLRELIAKNIEVEKPKFAVGDLASMVMTFFAGLSVEQSLKSTRASLGRKVENLMQVLLRTLREQQFSQRAQRGHERSTGVSSCVR